MQVITSFTAERVVGELLLIACTRVPQQEGSWPSLKLAIPKLEGAFTGTGSCSLQTPSSAHRCSIVLRTGKQRRWGLASIAEVQLQAIC